MRIIVKEKQKTIINIWIPNFNWVLKMGIKVAIKQKEVSISEEQKKALFSLVKIMKKQYRGLVLVDIKTKAGETVYVKL